MKPIHLKDWNWRSKFNSLEDATEFLLNYCRELGPLSEELLRRSGRNKEIIQRLTTINKQLRSGITNDRHQQKTF